MIKKLVKKVGIKLNPQDSEEVLNQLCQPQWRIP